MRTVSAGTISENLCFIYDRMPDALIKKQNTVFVNFYCLAKSRTKNLPRAAATFPAYLGLNW